MLQTYHLLATKVSRMGNFQDVTGVLHLKRAARINRHFEGSSDEKHIILDINKNLKICRLLFGSLS